MSGRPELWRLRVDLFAPFPNTQADPRFQAAIRSRLAALDETGSPGEVGLDHGAGEVGLDHRPGEVDLDHRPGGLAIDGGPGVIQERPVLGVLFWLRATTAGEAADLGIRLAAEAFRESFGVDADLYDVTVIPRAAVLLPDDPYYPERPD
jgi:hypothetical protein